MISQWDQGCHTLIRFGFLFAQAFVYCCCLPFGLIATVVVQPRQKRWFRFEIVVDGVCFCLGLQAAFEL